MKLRSFLLAIYCLLGYFSLRAQSAVTVVQFEFTFAGEPLLLDKPYYSPSVGDSIQLETLRFYISDPQLIFDRQQAVFATEQYYLLDAAVPGSLAITFPATVPSSRATLQFKLGIDSLTNVSGAKGGALDPINGLYWSWQSGYINVKIEGTSLACPARNNRFQFHLGGYQASNNSLQQVAMEVPATSVIRLQIDLETFFNKVDVGEMYQIMSPSQKAVSLAQLFATSFKRLLP